MRIRLSSPKGAPFNIADSDSDTPIVPDKLVPHTQNSMAGYEIIEGYARIVNVQPFTAVVGVPSLKKTQDHTRASTQLWTNTVRVAVNDVYNDIRNKLKVTQEAAKEFFNEFIPNLDQKDSREGVIETLGIYIEDTDAVHKKIENLIEQLNALRTSLEEDARNYGTVMGEIDKQKSLDETSIKKLREQIQAIDKEIDDLNNTITKKKVEEQAINRKLGISLGFAWSLPGLIATAVFKKQQSDASAAWHKAEESLVDKQTEKKDKSNQLGQIEKRIAYLTTLNNEFAKLLKNCSNSIAVIVNMADAWSTLSSNLQNIQERLETIKANDFNTIQKIKARLKLQVVILEKSIDRLNENVVKFEEAKLIHVPIDEGVNVHIAPNLRVSTLSAELINAYARRRHHVEMLK
jgi:DNA repair exonuclease SbcCD ATPase subunit